MRRLALSLAASLVSSALGAQGRLLPRPCVYVTPADRPPVGVGGGIPDCRPFPFSNIVRTRSDVHVELVGGDKVLRYEVDERFVNTGSVVGEADYVFPLPAGAAFQDLQLSINGELVAGETMNAADARRIYEDIVRRQRDPALVEWMGYGMLRARLFPLNPGEEKRVVVRFQSVAQHEGDALRVDYFRGTPPDATPFPRSPIPTRVAMTPSFTLRYKPSADLGTPYSPTHELDVSDVDGMREVSVRGGGGAGDARDVTLLIPVRRAAAASIAMLPNAPGGEDGFALITVTPPSNARREATPRDVTLVIDVSGSMQGRKIEQARAAGRQLLSTLRPADRFRIIDFSSDVHSFRDDFVNASDANVRDASHYLDQLDAGGATNIEGALKEALRGRVAAGRLPIVLFVTDGEPTVGEQRPQALVDLATRDSAGGGAESLPRRRIFTFGLGSDVNVSLLEQLALDGRGTAQFVRPDESVERMVGIVASRIVDPLMTNVRVRVDGGVQLNRALPSSASDIFAGRDLVMLARYSGHGSGRIVVDGMQGTTPVQWTSQVEFPDRDRSNAFVARLWATQRVGWLSAERHRNGPSSELDDEIRMLGERYAIPTELTSYLVREPGMVMTQTGMMGAVGGGRPAPMAAARATAFEAAKSASAARSVVSLAVADSLSAAVTAADMPHGAPATRVVANRRFVLRDGVWTDSRYRTEMGTTTVKTYSKAYFDLLDRIPELRSVFALGDRLIVAGGTQAIAVSDAGVDELSQTQLSTIAVQFR